MHRLPRRALVALAVLAIVVTALPAAALPSAAPVSLGPGNVVVLDEGWEISVVTDDLDHPVSLAERDGRILVVEAGRYHYAGPYEGQDAGRLRELAVGDDGALAAQRVVARDLADPVGLAVSEDGDVYLTQYGEVLRIDAEDYDLARPPLGVHSTGYPPQTTDFPYPPGTGAANDPVVTSVFRVDTTGGMGLAFDADGELVVLVGVDGPAPDDPLVREVTGQGYADDLSSSLVRPTGGEVDAGQVVARGCRNCLGLARAPEWHPLAGRLFATENTGPYRLRATAGPGRSALEGSSTTDVSVFDGINVVDAERGAFRRVAHVRPDSATLGAVPAGIAFAPPGFPLVGGEMLVSLYSGYAPELDNRGELHVVRPDLEHGAGTTVPFALGFDFPTDLLVGSDGALYVVEFFNGTLYRLVKR
jgi:glucose/arabinose dehydrogenase